MTILFRKGIIIAMLAGVLALAGGCSAGADEQRLTSFRERLSAAETVSAQARVTADTGIGSEEFTLRSVMTAEETTVEVVAPDIVAGVRAHITAGEDSLEYDGVMLSAGELTEDGLSALSALPALLSALRDAHVETLWRDSGALAVRLIPSDSVELTVWLGDAMTPQRAEIMSTADGRVVIACELTDFSIDKAA